jgi:malate dehydrogenase (oxaloacetate-decarboxylating)
MLVCDSHGILNKSRQDIENNPWKMRLASISNRGNKSGGLKEALEGADIFIGVSKGNILNPEWISLMNDKPVIFAMANPTPEIDPEEAKKAGAYIVGTGRSDLPNQINNLLAFPGVFLGAIEARAKVITNSMKIGAAMALASYVKNPTIDEILPSPLDKNIPRVIADKIKQIYKEDSASV